MPLTRQKLMVKCGNPHLEIWTQLFRRQDLENSDGLEPPLLVTDSL